MLPVDYREVHVPLRTNAPRVEPIPKRRGYTPFDEPTFDVNESDTGRAGQGYPPPLISPQQHAETILCCSTGAATAAIIADFFAYWRTIPVTQFSTRHLNASHSIRPIPVTSYSELWALGKPYCGMVPSFFTRSLLSNVGELGLYASVREWLRSRIVGRRDSRAASALVCGATAGGLACGLCAAVAHPYHVLETTARMSPRNAAGQPMFRRASDVWRAGLRDKGLRALLKGFQQGGRMAVAGGVVQGAVQFGGYELLREDGLYRHPLVFFFDCWFVCFSGVLCRYPFRSLRQLWCDYQVQATAASIFAPDASQAALVRRPPGYSSIKHHPQSMRVRQLSYRAVLASLRRNGGVTQLWKGFFTARPMLRAVPAGGLLYFYDSWMRAAVERQYPSRRRMPTTAQPLTGRSAPSKRLPPYEFDSSRASSQRYRQ